jgi:hypothetical protein
MNRYHTLIILLLAPLALSGQILNSGTYNTSNGMIDYVQYQASGNPFVFVLVEFSKEAEIALSDKFRPLIPVANKFNASIVGLNISTTDSTHRNEHVKSILIPDSASGHKIAVLDRPTSDDVQYYSTHGFDVILMDPGFDSIGELELNSELIGLIRGSSKSEKVNTSVETLKANGFWIPEKILLPYSTEISNELISDIRWIDSVAGVVRDSSKFALYSESVGIQNEIPDVVRQGKRLELSIKSASKGTLRIRFSDLSSKVIFEKNIELGKGFQSIELETGELEWGVYYLELKGQEISERHKFMIRG